MGETGRPNRKCCTIGCGARVATAVRVGVTPLAAERVGVGVNVGGRVGVKVMVGEGEGVAVEVGVLVAVGVGDLASAATITGCMTIPMTMIDPKMHPSATPAINATVSSLRVRGLKVTRRDYNTKGIISNPNETGALKSGLSAVRVMHGAVV